LILLRLGDSKLCDLANLWSYKIYYHEIKIQENQFYGVFCDFMKFCHRKCIIKMTSQFFTIKLSPPFHPLANFWLDRGWCRICQAL